MSRTRSGLDAPERQVLTWMQPLLNSFICLIYLYLYLYLYLYIHIYIFIILYVTL